VNFWRQVRAALGRQTPAFQPAHRKATFDVGIQWGHRIAAGARPDGPDPTVRRCYGDPYQADLGTPCGVDSIDGQPVEHVWRRITITDWHRGRP
jgi:hypothetical protein